VSLDHGSREVIPADRVTRRMRYPFLSEEFLTLQKAVAWHFGLDRARVAAASNLPPGGGLGSSAAVCVSLVAATAAYIGDAIDRAGIAEVAARIEMTVLRRPCGKQDQYTSAFGGANFLEFARDGSVTVSPIDVSAGIGSELERHLVLFTNGGRRNAAGPLSELVRRTGAGEPQTLRALAELKELAHEIRRALEAGDVPGVGRLLERGWLAKRRLHSQVSTPEIDRAIALAKEVGVYGGKLAGAGVSGSLVFICRPEAHVDLKAALATQGWRARTVRIARDGATLTPPADAASR
jgi:D-glycero-alpha-D-manno-heptose-7-phosphate kinase